MALLAEKISDYKYKTPIAIRFSDIDAVGHVNNAIYLTYFEMARFSYWRDVTDWNFSENGISIKYYNNHLDRDLPESDFLILHSRYFDRGKNIYNELRQDQESLINYLTEIRRTTAKLIWFDAADSSGSSDFSIIPYVDVFLKKQVLKWGCFLPLRF